jgi:subtilase family serine protease
MKLTVPFLRAAFVTFALLPLTAFALPTHNVPKVTVLGKDKGRVDPSSEASLTLILKLHNEAEYHHAVEELYNPASPTYRKWFTEKDFEKYAPTAEEFETVRTELLKHGLSVVSEDPQRFSIRVHGTTHAIESAFQTELHTFSYGNREIVAHVREAELSGKAGTLVASVAGLERHDVRPQIAISKDPRTGKPRYKQPAVKNQSFGGTLLSKITDVALTLPEPSTYASFDGSATGTFQGTVYDANPNLIVSFTPKQLQEHYGLTPLIAAGYDGTGQTIALVEGYGYPFAESDAKLAAEIFGLPPINASNFELIYPEGKPVNPLAGVLTGWDVEIALDIQSAHAIAPGAKIVVLASAGQDNEDQIASLQYIITNKIANTVSNSWENDSEVVAGPAEELAFDAVLERGAAAGISFQFSSGDSGDLGLGTPVGAVSIPSDSPYATAVGGTSILNDPFGTGQIVAGWGNDFAYLNLFGLVDPPSAFVGGGAGGGESTFFAKPKWQSKLPGKGRQVPDVSALADPYTGFTLVVSQGMTIYADAGVGGTSLASPIVTAIWAIADQFNGAPLGLMAATLPNLKPYEITDVVPTSVLNTNDVSGTIQDPNGTTNYAADDIFVTAPLYKQKAFPSAIWNLASYEAVAISFGTDSSLTVTPGWDNVTGYGEPNGLPFLQGVSGKLEGAPLVK